MSQFSLPLDILMRHLIHSTIEDVAKKEKVTCKVVQTILAWIKLR